MIGLDANLTPLLVRTVGGLTVARGRSFLYLLAASQVH